jgi:uncharacterized membrane protein YozB (DUF420 family)
MDVSSLPAVNASLNALATVFLVAGYVFIRRGNREMHKRCMLGALATSAVFLVCYLVYHYYAGSKPFTGQGPIRIVYFFILGTHIPLAAIIVPLALLTAFRGLRNDFARHVRIAKWTFPLWLYVSVTGVLVYLMLYQFPTS